MTRELDGRAAWNLGRWRESGWPWRWVSAHAGRWEHGDWLELLAALRRSEYWPMAAEAIGLTLEECRRQWWNLRRWQQSGEAKAWVDVRQGRWSHGDWLALLESLRSSRYWPLEPRGVGEVLEELQWEWRNLERWQDSGSARAWLDARQGQWDQKDLTGLWNELRQSEFWPIDPLAAEALLRRLTQEWWNVERWRRTDQARLWVEAHHGAWGHGEWLELVGLLRDSPFWPLDLEAVGRLLEEAKRQYENLQRWRRSGEPQRWVDSRGGQWTQEEVEGLTEALRSSRYWPVDPAAVEAVLLECRNLRAWQESDEARSWIDARAGRWDHADWIRLLGSLRSSAYWPVEPAAVGEVLRRLNLEWWNLRRWRAAGLARKWVQQRQGEWSDGDWQELLSSLRASEFWPVDPRALGRVLNETRAEWRQGRHLRKPPAKGAA
jgi:hypothetical protein